MSFGSRQQAAECCTAGSSEAYGDYAERVYELMEKLADTEFDAADQLATIALIQGLKSSGERGSLVLMLTTVAASGFNEDVRELKSAVRVIKRTAVEDKPSREEGRVLNVEANRKKETRKCYKCGRVGHLQRDCHQPKRNDGGQGNRPAAAMMIHAACVDAAPSKHAVEGALLYDSGASHHIVNDLKHIRDVRTSEVKRVVMGGGECHDVIAEGEVWLSGGPESLVVMRSVLCVPSMTANLLSGHLATEAEYVCNQADEACTIADKPGRVWPRGMKQKRLYRLDCKKMHASAVHEGYANVSSEAVSTRTWHARLGHPGRQPLTGADGVCDPSDESEFMPMPGPAPIPEPILDDDAVPPLEDSDDDEDAEEAEDSDDEDRAPDGDDSSDDEGDDGEDGAGGAGGAMHEQRYPQRERRAPDRYQLHAYAYAAGELSDEPRTLEEALGRPDAELWRQSMDAEWASLQEKGVLEKVDEVPRWKRVLPMKAVLKVKRDALGGAEKYKTRLVVLG